MSAPHVIPITIAHQTEPVRPVLTLTTGRQSSDAGPPEPADGEAQWTVRIPASFLNATEHPLSDRSRYLFLVLESLARDRTYCWPTNEQLCRITGRAKRAVQLTLDELESAGYILRLLHHGNKRVRIGIIMTRRVNSHATPTADTSEAVDAAKAALRSRRFPNALDSRRAQDSTIDRAQDCALDPFRAQDSTIDRAQDCALEVNRAHKTTIDRAHKNALDGDRAQDSTIDRAQNLAPRIKTNFEEDTEEIHIIRARAREGTGDLDESSEPFHAPLESESPPSPDPTPGKPIALRPAAPTRHEAMVAELGGALPGDQEVDEAMLAKTHAFIDRFFPMRDDLTKFVDEHRFAVPNSWLFRVLKRYRALNYTNVGPNGLRKVLRHWWKNNGPDAGPEDDYDDKMNLLPETASPEIATAAKKPRGYSPDTAPVIPPPRPQLTPEAKRRFSPEAPDATGKACATGKQSSVAASIQELKARAARAQATTDAS